MARLRQNFVSLFGGSLVAHQTFDVDFLGFESHISNNDPGALHGLYCKISVLRRRHLASKYFKINVYQSFTLHDVFKLVLTSCIFVLGSRSWPYVTAQAPAKDSSSVTETLVMRLL